MRWPRFSMSRRTTTGLVLSPSSLPLLLLFSFAAPAAAGLPADGFGSSAIPNATRGSSFLSDFLSAPFSSSLSGTSGDDSSLLSTATYTLRETRCSLLDMSSSCAVSATFVDAAKYRYLPLRSNTGKRASLMPSVTWKALPCAIEYTNTACCPLRRLFAYASHWLSGDHDGVNCGLSKAPK